VPARLAIRLVSALLLVIATAAPVAAQQASIAPGAGAWAPGFGASGDHNILAGVIDTPVSGASLPSGSIQVSGWFVDQSAQGWAGADDVEILSGAMESGGRPLAHAQFGQSRPDVAAALKSGFWAQSGWSASFSTVGLPSGPVTLWVYVHTPGKGWWQRQVAISLRPPATPASAPTSAFGNDISAPQCPSGAEPRGQAFAIVGVTGGKPFSPNPCLARQFVWALGSTSSNQSRVGVYMNTASPGPGASPNWPPGGTTTPRACDGSASADCAYDYGWLSAQDAYSRSVNVLGAALTAQVPWWLDVEAANTWSSDLDVNSATVQGAVAYLKGQNVSSLGIYSTSTDWEALIGQPSTSGPFQGLLNWRPGPAGPQDAATWCSRSVTGGRVKFVQFPNEGFDTDFACF
jgi:hypothetical protein